MALVGAALAIIAVVVGGPVRSWLAREATKRVARAYAQYRGYEEERQQLMGRLNGVSVPDDEHAVDGAVAALYREEAAQLRRLRPTLGAGFVLDTSGRHLASAMGAALGARAADLEADATWWAAPEGRGPAPPDPSLAGGQALDHAVALLVDRLHATGLHLPNDAPMPLHAADSTLVQLGHWADLPTGAVLFVGDGGALDRLDVDASTSDTVALGGHFGPSGLRTIIGRAGWVAALTDDAVVVAIPGRGQPQVLAREADAVFAAERPDAVWVLTPRGLTEMDGRGDLLVPGWQAVPDAVVTTGLAADGFVIGTRAGTIQVWSPLSGAFRAVTTKPSVLLASQGDTVVWEDAPASVETASVPVHVTDLATGRDSVVRGPLDVGFPSATDHNPWTATPCAFSPDGELVACPDLTHGIAGAPGDTYQLAVINVRTATSTVIAGATSDQPEEPVVWTADSQRVFMVTSGAGAGYIATWARNAAAAVELRFRPVGAEWPHQLALGS